MTRRIVRVEGIAPVARGYPAAVVANGLAFIGGVRGGRTDRDRRFVDLPREFRENGFSGFPIVDQAEGEFAVDGWAAHENLDLVIKAAGADEMQVLRQHIWLRDKRLFPVYERTRMAWQKVPAPSSCLGVADMVGRFGRSVGLDALALVPGENALFPERATTRTFDNREFPSAGFYRRRCAAGPLCSWPGIFRSKLARQAHRSSRALPTSPRKGVSWRPAAAIPIAGKGRSRRRPGSSTSASARTWRRRVSACVTSSTSPSCCKTSTTSGPFIACTRIFSPTIPRRWSCRASTKWGTAAH